MRELVFRRVAYRSVIADIARLAKLRLELLILFATAAGFCMASGGEIEWERLIGVLLGTGFLAAGAGVLNQVIECRTDGQMARTRDRPISEGRVSTRRAATLGLALVMCGLGVLAWKTTLPAAAFAGMALILYLAVYTPLKKRTSLCVVAGAVAGALPPVIGWTAWDGSIAMQTGVLFGIVFAWQMPHVMAIAWMHRHEYAAAGLELLPRNDPSGRHAASRALWFSALLVAITLIPAFNCTAIAAYLGGISILNAVLMIAAVQFLRTRSMESARGLFLASIIYLPLLLTLMILL